MTETTTPKNWLVTGASRGIGRELTEQLLRRGDRVAATVRNPAALDEFAAAYPDRLVVEALDVTDTAALRAVVGRVFDRFGSVDVVVSNAGGGVFGVAEDVSDAQVDAMIGTNLTGSIQLTRAVVPRLREQGGGVLVQLSSMGGQMSFPAFSLYHATKWGIEGFFDSLAVEVEPFGIHTVLVEPGVVRTTFFDAAERVPVSAPYRGGPADRPPIPTEEMQDDPIRVAALMIEAAESADPPRRLLLGSDAQHLVRTALAARLAEADAQLASAARADY